MGSLLLVSNNTTRTGVCAIALQTRDPIHPIHRTYQNLSHLRQRSERDSWLLCGLFGYLQTVVCCS